MSDNEQKKTSSPKKKVAIGIIAGVLAISVITVFAAIVVQTLSVKNYFKSADSTPPTVVEKFENGLKEEIKIQNDSAYSVYVRAKLVFTLQDKQGNILGIVPEGVKTDLELDSDNEANVKEQNADSKYVYIYNEGSALVSEADGLGKANQWIYNEVDGFYYYTSPVNGTIASADAAGRQTAVLMDYIIENSESTLLKDYDDYDLHVEVLSQFVQVAGNADEYTEGKYDPTKDGVPPIEDAWGAKIDTNEFLDDNVTKNSKYKLVISLPSVTP